VAPAHQQPHSAPPRHANLPRSRQSWSRAAADPAYPGWWDIGTTLALSRSMSILSIILVIVVVGVLLWALNSFVPMDSKVKSILNIVVVILLIVWLLRAFGLIGTLSNIHV
jgi:hypothetical protein